MTEMAIAVRATGERTCAQLCDQIRKQSRRGDVVHVFNTPEPFVDKMQSVYRWCLEQNKPVSLIIDADILIRPTLLKTIRRVAKRMAHSDAGFGIQLFDRFFHRPKFRGIHVYKTACLPLFLNELPHVVNDLRPETAVKKRVENQGYKWKNDLLTFYVGGLHDFHQWHRDIYFKMLVRSHRSPDLVAINYIPDDGSKEYVFAKQGLEDGAARSDLQLDKQQYVNPGIEERPPMRDIIDVEQTLKKALRKHYGISLWYFASLYTWFAPLLNWRLRNRKTA